MAYEGARGIYIIEKKKRKKEEKKRRKTQDKHIL
jgi:hypothetical protein